VRDAGIGAAEGGGLAGAHFGDGGQSPDLGAFVSIRGDLACLAFGDTPDFGEALERHER
jgi:hypothetical protein